jgi:AcrR family transcriptional regulator
MARQSLRERQRLEVRSELQRTSLRLFLARGFDDVAISDVTDEVGVSQRTFYRYFPTKEDVVLSLLDDFAPAVHQHLREHPAGDAPWKVVHDALTEAVQRSEPVDPAVMRMIFETPRLLSAYNERQRRWEAMMAEVLAERLGVDSSRFGRRSPSRSRHGRHTRTSCWNLKKATPWKISSRDSARPRSSSPAT